MQKLKHDLKFRCSIIILILKTIIIVKTIITCKMEETVSISAPSMLSISGSGHFGIRYTGTLDCVWIPLLDLDTEL